MNRDFLSQALVLALAGAAPALALAQTSNGHNPTWWDKFEYLAKNGPDPSAGATTSVGVGDNVDVSNECGPQSETYITLNPKRPKMLAAGSNEIFRLPMRGYFSSDSGATWGGVDLPLPPPLQGTNDTDFASDPTLAFDTRATCSTATSSSSSATAAASRGRRWPWRARPTEAGPTPR